MLLAFITRSVVIPEMAQARSYRDFMRQVNHQLEADDALYLYGDGFSRPAVIFYRDGLIESFDETADKKTRSIAAGKEYFIMTERTWNQLQNTGQDLSPPIVRSEGKGPEGDAPLVLVQR
jgi:hypothetical protein